MSKTKRLADAIFSDAHAIYFIRKSLEALQRPNSNPRIQDAKVLALYHKVEKHARVLTQMYAIEFTLPEILMAAAEVISREIKSS